MNALLAKLREADAAPAPQQTDEEIVDSIKSLSDDAEEVAAFLSQLVEIDAARTKSYFRHLKALFPKTFQAMKVAMEEYAQEEETEVDVIEEPDEEEPEGDTLPMGQDEDVEPPEESPQQEEVEEIVEDEEVADEGDEEEPEGDTLPIPVGQDDEDEEAPPVPPEEEEEEPEEEEASTDEIAVEPVVDPIDLEEDPTAASAIDMLLFGKESENPHWSVFANGKPLAEIQLQDQENAEEIKDIFTSDDYPQHIADACASSVGIIGTLKALNARWYGAAVHSSDMAEDAREAAVASLENQFSQRLAHVREDLLNTVHLAIVASNKGSKGLFVENRLKGAIVEAFRQAGVPTSQQIVNEVWVEAAQNYMGDILKAAEKWMSYSPETMAEVTKEILGTNVEPEDEDVPVDPPQTPEEIQQAQANKSGIQNVPIRTAKVVPHGHEEDYRQAQQNRVASSLSRRMGRAKVGL